MLTTAEGEKVGASKIAAKEGISMVVMSRVFMAAPGKICQSLKKEEENNQMSNKIASFLNIQIKDFMEQLQLGFIDSTPWAGIDRIQISAKS